MNNKKELDSLGLAGVIVNIIVTGAESIGSAVLIVAGFTGLGNSTAMAYLIGGLFVSTLSIITLVFNAKVLSGELMHKKIASVMGFICLSVLGSVLLTISKEDNKSSDNKEDNLISTITKLKELLDLKTISEEEFTEIKKRLIS